MSSEIICEQVVGHRRHEPQSLGNERKIYEAVGRRQLPIAKQDIVRKRVQSAKAAFHAERVKLCIKQRVGVISLTVTGTDIMD
ncbi:hypothetical protein A5706_22480 [Mycobacterium sp. E796]|nr:hypothetical protein A5706_22480 [Mycobacterium sp. E796]